MHLYPLYGTEFSKLSTDDNINDNQLSYIMSSSNVCAACFAYAIDRVLDDNRYIIHKPRTVYVVIPPQPFTACISRLCLN